MCREVIHIAQKRQGTTLESLLFRYSFSFVPPIYCFDIIGVFSVSLSLYSNLNIIMTLRPFSMLHHLLLASITLLQGAQSQVLIAIASIGNGEDVLTLM